MCTTFVYAPTDVRQQAWRDTAFCQALGSTIAVFTEQLQAALSGGYTAGCEGRGEGSDLSRAWLEQLGMLGLLVCFRSLLSPSQVDYNFWSDGNIPTELGTSTWLKMVLVFGTISIFFWL